MAPQSRCDEDTEGERGREASDLLLGPPLPLPTASSMFWRRRGPSSVRGPTQQTQRVGLGGQLGKLTQSQGLSPRGWENVDAPGPAKHLQVEDQVVEAFLGDAVMQAYCGDRRDREPGTPAAG